MSSRSLTSNRLRVPRISDRPFEAFGRIGSDIRSNIRMNWKGSKAICDRDRARSCFTRQGERPRARDDTCVSRACRGATRRMGRKGCRNVAVQTGAFPSRLRPKLAESSR